MAESTSGQDKENPVNWLASHVGKVAAFAHVGSCHLDLMRSQCCKFNKHLFVEVNFGLASIFFQQKNKENSEQESISKKSKKKKEKKKRGPRLSHAELWDI